MIQRVGVVGAGTMGLGIAQLCAQNGFSVKIHDPVSAALASFPGRLRAALDSAVLKGRLTIQQGDRAGHSVSPAPLISDLAGADLVIEAGPEDLGLKQEIFAALSVACPDSILATNTSSLSVAAVSARATAPERVLGMHFFNPPVAMKLVEMIRAPRTSPVAFQIAWEFVLAGLRRTPVDVQDRPGFIVNRVMRPYYVTAQSMVGRPAGFVFIDEACRGLGGVPMGPFELMDLIGLDTNLAITRAIFEALGRPTRFTPPQLQTTLVERGALGRKSRRGFYQYTDGKPSGENADAVALLPTLPPCSREEVWDRLRGALTAEALMLVAEGGASRGDVDTAIKLAMNFPQGPLQWQNANPAEKSA